ncbi:MAG: hypothetical protein O9289_07265 [Rhodobacteraceae bacterium]|jgi:hypothetical protein|nr:hypothetical protein [Paracoccaceae bacterium]MCZ8082990.1 hypothetical protein [Paracoccaceae bacterium]
MQDSEWNVATFTVKREGAEAVTITVVGRVHWVLERLIKEGKKSCKPNDNAAPHWTSCVYKLRYAGVHVETVKEPHTKVFAATHARYVLRDSMERVV